jgi:hypothetical protein
VADPLAPTTELPKFVVSSATLQSPPGKKPIGVNVGVVQETLNARASPATIRR